jgi:hypothetical protein
VSVTRSKSKFDDALTSAAMLERPLPATSCPRAFGAVNAMSSIQMTLVTPSILIA